MRKLIPLMLVSLLFPVAGYPLGLGEIRLHSALNQPLSAEIDLLSVSPEDEASIRVGLASSEVFAQLGVDRTSTLLLVSFEVSKRPDGSYYIKTFSKQPIREPYLDFLLEVNWKAGHALREYTVLLDPPEMKQSAAAVEPPAPSAMSPEPMVPDAALDAAVAAAEQEEAAAPAGEAGKTPAAGEGEQATSESPKAESPKAEEPVTAEAKTPAESTAAAEAAPEAQPPAAQAKEEQVAAAAPAPAAEETAVSGAPARSGVITYGPVRKDDTLWKIARKVRPDNASVPQVMAALVRENPYAFYGRNGNRLKAGHVLRLDPAQLAGISREEAAREIALQGREWNDYKQRAAAQATARKPTNAPEADRSVGVAAARKEEPHLKLVTPPASTQSAKDKLAAPGTGAADADALRKELLLAIETTEAQKQENADLRKRLTELEGQLANMQRLLSLKDNDLAALQHQAAQVGAKDKNAKPGVTQPPSVAAAPAAKPVPAPAAQPATAAQPGAPAAQPSAPAAQPSAPAAQPSAPAAQPSAPAAAPAPAVPAAAQPPAPAAATSPAGAPGAVPATVPGAVPADKAAPTPEKKPAADKKPPKKAVPATPAPAPESGGIFSNPFYLGFILALGIFLAAAGYVVIRRRRSGAGFQESILMGSSPSLLKAKAAEGAPKEETSFFSDFAVSGMGDIHAEDSEVDPLTEADVYMAYQRFQQAEELLRDAMKSHDRPELHVKLLEVYHATRDKAAFETEANKVNGMLNGTGPLWEKVQALGHDLLPENALFAKAPDKVPPAASAPPDARLDNEVLDIGLDLDALAEEMESGGAQGGGEFNLDLGVDFSDLDSGKSAAAPAAAPTPAATPAPAAKPAPAAAPAPAAPAKEEPVEFDLGDLNLHLDEAPAAPAAAAKAAAEPETIELGGLDLGDLDFSAAETPAPAKGGAGLAGVAAASELDLSGLELGTVEEEQPAAGGGLGDFDLSELDNLQIDAAPTGQDDDALFANLDEAGTKLDLARAYMEMGDPDGARSILDEVSKEGNPSQKQQAQELLKQIA